MVAPFLRSYGIISGRWAGVVIARLPTGRSSADTPPLAGQRSSPPHLRDACSGRDASATPTIGSLSHLPQRGSAGSRRPGYRRAVEIRPLRQCPTNVPALLLVPRSGSAVTYVPLLASGSPARPKQRSGGGSRRFSAAGAARGSHLMADVRLRRPVDDLRHAVDDQGDADDEGRNRNHREHDGPDAEKAATEQ
jgi:hypothetical protein